MNSDLSKIYEKFGGYLTPEEEADLFSVSVHEVGHGLVAAQFGLASEELVVSANAAVCVHQQGSPLANAAVSFGGVLAQGLCNCRSLSMKLPEIPLTKFSLCRWVDTLPLRELSWSDRQGIESYPNRNESARVAFDILSTSLDALEYLARSLADRSRQKFAKASLRPSFLNQAEVDRWVCEQNEAAAAKVMDQKLRRAVIDGERILASLPPVRIPEVFNYETFKAASGASDDEIKNFCAYRVQCERWQIGLGAPSPEAIETAVTFFNSNAVHTRHSWIFQAREFAAWKNTNKKI